MQDNLPCKKSPWSSRLDERVGRGGSPNLRWMEVVTRDAERPGVRNWRIKAEDRDGCSRLSDLAKALQRL